MEEEAAVYSRSSPKRPDGIVAYYDIRQFYPSISSAQVGNAWSRAADDSQLEASWRELGIKLLSDYAVAGRGTTGLLVGPMFAHLMGNQVLRDFDTAMMAAAPGSYFRYVDDVALVISADERVLVAEILRRSLPEGMRLNEEKSFEIGAAEWIQRSDAFPDAVGTRYWARFIGALKYFLVVHAERGRELARLLRNEGFRIPLLDYARAVQERGYVARLMLRLREPWFDRTLCPSTSEQVLVLARETRRQMQSRFDTAIAEPLLEKGMVRKFQIQRLRYTASRLIYLAPPDQFPLLESQLEGVRELSELTAILRALRTADVTTLLPFSGSVAQAAAQVLLVHGAAVSCTTDVWPPELEFAWAVLELSGVPFRADATKPSEESLLVRFARGERAVVPNDPYYRELFALSRASKIRPAALVAEALDRDEDPTFDLLDLFHISS